MNMSEKIQPMESRLSSAGIWIRKAPPKSSDTLEMSRSHPGQVQHQNVSGIEAETVDLHISAYHPCEVRYQIVYSHIDNDIIESYDTYGIQCLCRQSDIWIPIDTIEDISVHSEKIVSLISQFIALQLSPLHFRDAVLDSISE